MGRRFEPVWAHNFRIPNGRRIYSAILPHDSPNHKSQRQIHLGNINIFGVVARILEVASVSLRKYYSIPGNGKVLSINDLS